MVQFHPGVPFNEEYMSIQYEVRTLFHNPPTFNHCTHTRFTNVFDEIAVFVADALIIEGVIAIDIVEVPYYKDVMEKEMKIRENNYFERPLISIDLSNNKVFLFRRDGKIEEFNSTRFNPLLLDPKTRELMTPNIVSTFH